MDKRYADVLPDKGIKVIEVEHVDASSLMAITYYGNSTIFAKDTNWPDEEARNLRLLK